MQPVTGIRLFLSPVQDLRIGGRQGNSTYQYTLMADSSADLKNWSEKLSDALEDSPVLQNVDSDLAENGVESFVTVDKDTAARVGISSRDVDNALYDAFGQRNVATIYEDINQYSVILGWRNADADVKAGRRTCPTCACRRALTRPRRTSATVPTNPALRDPSTGSALSQHDAQHGAAAGHREFRAGADRGDRQPPGHRGRYDHLLRSRARQGAVGRGDRDRRGRGADRHAEHRARHLRRRGARLQAAQGQQPLLILAALVTIYIVLGMLYESLIHPITVLSTLPAAGVGAVLALMMFGMDFSIIALIGVFLLLGIVKKNAILIIDFALEAQRSRGLTAEAAAREACLLRFRPILMTTLAAALGALPLAIGFGEGAELRRPLGVAIIGGLIASQLLTLITTPVVYVCLDRLAAGRRERRDRRHRLRELPA